MAANPNDTAGGASHDDSRQSDLAVLDANEYKNKRRLERLLDAIDNIPDQADRAREQYNHGEIDMHARRIAVQDAVSDAIWEAWNLLKEHEHEQRRQAGQALIDYYAEHASEDFNSEGWEPADIKISRLEKAYNVTGRWPHSRYFHGHPEVPKLGTIAQENQGDIVVWGLKDFHGLDELWTENWTEREKPFDCPPRTVQRQRNYTVPRDISWKAAIRLKEFLNDQHDMEIQFESIGDQLPKWGFKEVDGHASD